jgi:membrane-bound lytic murein transglycosylase B
MPRTIRLLIVAVTTIGVAGVLSGSADTAQAPTQQAEPSQPQSSPATPPGSVQQAPDQPQADTRPAFADWLEALRTEALSRGIRADVVDRALAEVVEPLPVVIERDRTQAETVLTLEAYLSRQITPARVRTGRQMLSTHADTLERVSAAYGVPARIIAAVWGLESNFGRFSGVRPTIAALATLAWDARRSAYFRGELFNALRILDRGDIDLPRLKGSWAGAMGQPQFMPSSYLQFAEDFDGDGRRDIWTTTGDVFASIANYLKGHGWTAGQTWGREVAVAPAAARAITRSVQRRAGGCQATRDMTVFERLDEWQRLGVRTVGGGRLPKADLKAALVSGGTRHFLVYSNYDALLQYNCAHAYALSVGLLGDRLNSQPASRPQRPSANSR